MGNTEFSADWDTEETTQFDAWVPVVQPAINEPAEYPAGRWEGWTAECIVRELRADLEKVTHTELTAFDPAAFLALA